MKRFLLWIPLLALAPLGYFLGSYLSGLGILHWYAGYVIASVSMFVVPLLVSVVFLILFKARWIGRTIVFIVALFVQESIFLLHIVPSRTTAEVMGIAHRMRHEVPPNQLRDCANQLLARFHAGTLKLKSGGDGGDYFPADDSATVVEDTELPVSLRGRFQRTFIQPVPSIGNDVVIFALDHETGIICGNHILVHDYGYYPIADGVEVYQDHP